MRRLSAILFCGWPWPVAAAEPAICSVGEEGGVPFGDVTLSAPLTQTMARARCGVPVAEDVALWQGYYRSKGCSDGSRAAKAFRWFWTAGADHQKAEFELMIDLASSVIRTAQLRYQMEFCRTMRRVGPPALNAND